MIRVLERTRRDIVGTLRKGGSFLFVVPIDPSYKHDLYVNNAREADVGKRVVVRFSSWPNRHVSPEAELVDVIGHPDRASVDTLAVVRHFDLREDFPAEVLEDAETASQLMDKPGARLDLRDRLIVTINPASARDFDDAVLDVSKRLAQEMVENR